MRNPKTFKEWLKSSRRKLIFWLLFPNMDQTPKTAASSTSHNATEDLRADYTDAITQTL